MGVTTGWVCINNVPLLLCKADIPQKGSSLIKNYIKVGPIGLSRPAVLNLFQTLYLL